MCEVTESKKCRLQGDVRTFCIALLTTLIVLALYHFGMGICAILTGTSSCASMPVSRDYVLVPVSAMPQKALGFGEGRRFRRGDFQRGDFPRGGQGEFRRRGFRHHGGPGNGMPMPGNRPAPGEAPANRPAPADAPAS